jgi:hypothetical protein
VTGSDKRGLLATVGFGALLVVCCAAFPVLLAAGTLGALGGVLSSPWLLAAAGALVVAALVVTVIRIRGRPAARGESPDASTRCCPPQRDRGPQPNRKE